MYIIAAILGSVYFVLYLLARKEAVDDTTVLYMRPFMKISRWIYRFLQTRHIAALVDGKVAQSLERLYPGQDRDLLIRRHWEKKLTLSLVVLLAGTVLGLLISLHAESLGMSGKKNGIARGDYHSGSREIELEVGVGEVVQRFSVEIESRKLTETERNDLFKKFREQLPKLILGENISPEQVTGNLYLEESYPEYPFLVSWSSDHPEIVSQSGTVSVVEEKQWVQLTATVAYEDWEEALSIRVCVTEPVMTEEEREYQELREFFLDSEKNSRNDEKWVPPTIWREKEVRWRQVTEDNGLLLWVAGLCVAVLLFPFADKDVSDSLKKRKQSMQHDYPEVVHKLALYMGAGMTIRGSFNKIAGDYIQGRKEGKREQPVYEEIVFTCRELQTGISEGVAYEHFGKRSGVQEYIRLSTLLAQNLKKGNGALLQRLGEEADRANEEHVQYARKKGEEAQTKLLLPMVMMLLVVMLLLILPAFWAIQN